MQRFPIHPDDNARPPRADRETVAIPSVEEHRDQAELDATADWLAHIPVLSLPKGRPAALRSGNSRARA